MKFAGEFWWIWNSGELAWAVCVCVWGGGGGVRTHPVHPLATGLGCVIPGADPEGVV